MRRARIKIATVDGFEWRTCLARKNGLAITRGPSGEKGWTVTHVATGRRVNRLSLLPLRSARTAFVLASSLGHWGDFVADMAPPDHVLDALDAIAEMVEG